MTRALGVVLALLVALVAPVVAASPDARPAEAPLVAQPPDVPTLPPEYLLHDEAGIRFAYHPSARERVRMLIEDAGPVRAELSERLGRAVLANVEVRMARGSSDFERIVPGGSEQGQSMLAFGQLRLLVMSLRATPSAGRDVRAAFRRGMAYLALDEVVGLHAAPRWFRLGFALDFSGVDSLARARALWWASMERRLIPLVDLDWHLAGGVGSDSLAAAEAADFVDFLSSADFAEDAFPRLLETTEQIAREQPDLGTAALEAGLARVYQGDAASLEGAWREDFAKHRAFLPVLLGGTALWVAIALAVQLRRRLRRSRPEPRPAPPEKPRRRRRSRRSLRPLPPPRVDHGEVDVPKVSHDGRWHTLH
ncbi:MAG: hypothetical protein R3B72_34710 [Polyangiaceae bacterium]